MFLKASELFWFSVYSARNPAPPPPPPHPNTHAGFVVSRLCTLSLAYCSPLCSLVIAPEYWGRDGRGYISFTNPGAGLHTPLRRAPFLNYPGTLPVLCLPFLQLSYCSFLFICLYTTPMHTLSLNILPPKDIKHHSFQ